jgi:hypothetical protein
VPLSADTFVRGGAVSAVDFYANGTLIGSTNISPYTFVWQNVPAGRYQLTALATSESGTQASTTASNSLISFATARCHVVIAKIDGDGAAARGRPVQKERASSRSNTGMAHTATPGSFLECSTAMAPPRLPRLAGPHPIWPLASGSGNGWAGSNGLIVSGTDAANTDFSGTFTFATAGSAGNYVVFPDCTGENFTILAIHGTSTDGTYRGPVNGFRLSLISTYMVKFVLKLMEYFSSYGKCLELSRI